jgi:uncharacterized protein YdgA (DUF945 family)
MKVIRPIIVLVAAVLAFLPFYGGYEAQRAYVDLVDGMRMGARGQMGVESEFHRGWLRSTAVTRLVGTSPEDPLGITLHHTFIHGPIPFGELLRGRLPTSFALAIVETDYRPDFAERSPWKEGLDGRPLVRFRTTAEPGAWIKTVVESPAIHVETVDGELTWEGIHGTAIATRDLETSSGVIEAPSLELRSGGEVLRLKDASLEFDNETTANGLLDGAFVLSLAELSVESAGETGGGLLLRDWSSYETSDEDLAFDTYEIRVGTAFEEAVIDGDRFGPGAIEVALRNLQASGLREFGEQLEALAEQRQGHQETAFSPLNLQMDALPKLVALSPEIVLTRFELVSEGGELAGTARIGIDGEKARGMPMPLFLPMAVEADASIFVPTTMFHRLVEAFLMSISGNDGPIPPNQTRQDLKAQAALSRSQLVDSLLESGYVAREGGGYRVRLRLREGQLWLNGRPAGFGGFSTARAPSDEPDSMALAFPR